MTERPTPYVGVSGVVNPEQQAKLHEIWDTIGVRRVLALGVKATHKTQWDDIENKYGAAWYPVGDAIAGAMSAERTDELRVAQVCLDTPTASRPGGREYEKAFIDRLLARTGDMLNAIQFDMLPWDSQAKTGLFAHIKEARPDMTILVQANKHQMAAHGPKELVRRLNWYDVRGEKYIDRVLFDASHGTGERLDVGNLEQFVREAIAETEFGVGIAGGLHGPIIREELAGILARYPGRLSFDAEGQLHKNPDGSTGLNMAAAEDYLRAAGDVLKSL